MTRYRIAESVGHREIEGQTLLLVPDESDLLTLNPTGQFIWRRLVKRQPVDTIVRAFARHFHISTTIAQRDVLAFLRMLQSRRLIRRA